MLSPNQEKYLLTIPEDKIISIRPFDPRATDIAKEIINKIHTVSSKLEVLFLGASALKIAGQGDLDISICSDPDNFPKYLPDLKRIFGEPIFEGNFIKWSFNQEGFDIELYLTDCSDPSTKEQIELFELLRNNQQLLKEYENLKIGFNNLSFRKYQRSKYEFFNRVLSK